MSQREWLILWEGSRKGNIQNWLEKLGIFPYSKAGEAVSKLIDMLNHLVLITPPNPALTVHFVKENQPGVLPRTLLPFYLLTPRPSFAHTGLHKSTLLGAWVSAHTVFILPGSGIVGPGVWGQPRRPSQKLYSYAFLDNTKLESAPSLWWTTHPPTLHSWSEIRQTLAKAKTEPNSTHHRESRILY